MKAAEYLKALNAEQRQAVEHGIQSGTIVSKRPFLVIAGAGSGKTTVIANRVAHLIASGANPQRILLLTFSRRAAEEMSRRVGRIVSTAISARSIDLPWAGTFHSIGQRLLREFAPRIGLKPSFTILDRSDAEDLMNIVRYQLGLSKTLERFPQKQTCLAIFSYTVNSRTPLEEVLSKQFPYCADSHEPLKRLFAAYVKAKQRQNVLDYDDLLLLWSAMMNDPEIAQEIGRRFDHVLVDEYQDTNSLQADILLKMKPKGDGLLVVGDDAQSIYSFRSATIRNILDYPRQFKPSARVVTLEHNYRSTQPILWAANEVIGLAAERFTKNLRSDRKSKQKPCLITVADEAAQAEYVARRILNAREMGLPLKSQATLVRASSHSALLELELTRRNIPFVKYGGMKFLETAHVKDMVCVLRWAENSSDRLAGFRMLSLMPGIGPATASRILNFLQGRDVLKSLAGLGVPKATAEDWPAFVSLMQRLMATKKSWPAEFEWVRSWYEPHLKRIHDDAHLRAADLVQLQGIAGTYSSRRKFLTELTLNPPDSTAGHSGAPSEDEDYTIISTIHSAKGLEWKAVYILNVIDGCIPSQRATGTPDEIEEERRLLYVAMTRAKDQLTLMVPHQYFTPHQGQLGDRHGYSTISRFIPDSLRKWFDCRSWGVNQKREKLLVRRVQRKINIVAGLQRMWR
jgi:DNA helicase-2/ATP-dependent DNA helicase PcrA